MKLVLCTSAAGLKHLGGLAAVSSGILTSEVNAAFEEVAIKHRLGSLAMTTVAFRNNSLAAGAALLVVWGFVFADINCDRCLTLFLCLYAPRLASTGMELHALPVLRPRLCLCFQVNTLVK